MIEKLKEEMEARTSKWLKSMGLTIDEFMFICDAFNGCVVEDKYEFNDTLTDAIDSGLGDKYDIDFEDLVSDRLYEPSDEWFEDLMRGVDEFWAAKPITEKFTNYEFTEGV